MKYDFLNNNKVYLCGDIVSDPVFSHEIYGEGFYELKLSIPRLSDYKDIIPITISERLLHNKKIKIGNKIAVKGQFRSYNKVFEDKLKLVLSVFVRELVEPDDNANPNMVELTGFICKPPVFRVTPFNREICDLLLAVNRAYKKSDYLPCIAWGRNAKYLSTIEVGKKVIITGRVQSREYQKKLDDGSEVIKTAYEVSVDRITTDDSL